MRTHPLLLIALSLGALKTGTLQSSVALALPKAASMSAPLGLHPAFKVVPVAVITGPVESTVQLTVRETLLLLPQASVALKVRV